MTEEIDKKRKREALIDEIKLVEEEIKTKKEKLLNLQKDLDLVINKKELFLEKITPFRQMVVQVLIMPFSREEIIPL